MLDDQSGRILALEAALADALKSLTVHDLLLRALLTQLALAEPGAFESLVQGFSRAGDSQPSHLAGAMTRDVADELAGLLGEIIERVRSRG